MTHHPDPRDPLGLRPALPGHQRSHRRPPGGAATTRVAGSAAHAATSGPLGRLRDGLGVRLIELGAALVADDTVKRRVIRS